MRFGCKCGNIIRDTTDFLSYKADILASQDEEDFCEGMESLVTDESLSKVVCMNKLMSLYTHYAMRSIYQCSECGRLYVEDPEGKLHCFVPEEHTNKELLISVAGRNWKGLLWANWKDVKPEWSEHHGYIDVNTNESYDNQVFDDKESFLECYYELFDELRQKNLIRSARLHENGECTHTWLDGM